MRSGEAGHHCFRAYLLPGLLTAGQRYEQFDAPGLLLAGQFLLVWSRLSPSPFLARLIATAPTVDLLALAEQAERWAAADQPELEGDLTGTMQIYRNWHGELQPALAIAWTRCRNAAVAWGCA